MNKDKAVVMDIQRYSLHDGPGIRTTVFLKGCNLACRWCHNPESQAACPELMYEREKCIKCGICIEVCEEQQHWKNSGESHVSYHCPNSRSCLEQGISPPCVQHCPAQALQRSGELMSPEEVAGVALEDVTCYGSHGGITFSGGEPFLQGAFLKEMLPLCKDKGLHVCVDTALSVPWQEISEHLPFTDLLLADIKTMDPVLHKELTGADNALILENIRRLDEQCKEMYIRMPLLAGINDREADLHEAAAFLADLSHVSQVDFIPVMNHARSKYAALGRNAAAFNEGADDQELIARARRIVLK